MEKMVDVCYLLVLHFLGYNHLAKVPGVTGRYHRRSWMNEPTVGYGVLSDQSNYEHKSAFTCRAI